MHGRPVSTWRIFSPFLTPSASPFPPGQQPISTTCDSRYTSRISAMPTFLFSSISLFLCHSPYISRCWILVGKFLETSLDTDTTASTSTIGSRSHQSLARSAFQQFEESPHEFLYLEVGNESRRALRYGEVKSHESDRCLDSK